ncbi:hypothetical protein ACFSTE_21100 [Aquimarina hainanensis]|uniref:Uncharacterized protein n=1 Tax=Aquimarina hainanensis TaxID=1578017 RepID=A0ABW5NCS3_9FLAO
MIKRLLELFKRRKYLSTEKLRDLNRDYKERTERKIDKEIEDKLKTFSLDHIEEKRKRIEIETFLEIMVECPERYTESEITKIMSEII